MRVRNYPAADCSGFAAVCYFCSVAGCSDFADYSGCFDCSGYSGFADYFDFSWSKTLLWKMIEVWFLAYYFIHAKKICEKAAKNYEK